MLPLWETGQSVQSYVLVVNKCILTYSYLRKHVHFKNSPKTRSKGELTKFDKEHLQNTYSETIIFKD